MADDGEIFQESPRLKAQWKAKMEDTMSVGTRVRVLKSDDDAKDYIGLTGVVVRHDVGINGEWPMVSVEFDNPPAGRPARDGFYDDELEVVNG